jgi:hypothetical protein
MLYIAMLYIAIADEIQIIQAALTELLSGFLNNCWKMKSERKMGVAASVFVYLLGENVEHRRSEQKTDS